jgi:hypothetical protein
LWHYPSGRAATLATVGCLGRCHMGRCAFPRRSGSSWRECGTHHRRPGAGPTNFLWLRHGLPFSPPRLIDRSGARRLRLQGQTSSPPTSRSRSSSDKTRLIPSRLAPWIVQHRDRRTVNSSGAPDVVGIFPDKTSVIRLVGCRPERDDRSASVARSVPAGEHVSAATSTSAPITPGVRSRRTEASEAVKDTHGPGPNTACRALQRGWAPH